MNKFSLAARSVTFAAIAGLSLSLTAPAALAAPQVSILAQSPVPDGGATGPTITPGNINFDRTGSITIHKRDITGAQQGAPASGLEQQDVPGRSLEGVTFSVQKVAIDLSQVNNWNDLPQTAAAAEARGLEGDVKTGTTDEQGKVTIGDLPIGLYVVKETNVPPGVVPGAPFLVSIPMTTPDRSAWNYDPVVYPKNTTITAEKSVEDADQQLGENITYSISAPVPTLQTGQTVRKFVVRDDYDESKLQINADFAQHVSVRIGDETVPASAYQVTDEDGVLTVAFTNFELLNNPDNQGKQVTVSFQAEVTAVGRIVNSADVIVNNPSNEDEIEDVTTPTPPVESFYGSLELLKTDAAGEQPETPTPLAGAKFRLYQANDAGQCVADELVEDRRLTVGSENEWTTNAEGRITISGLHVTSFENNAPVVGQKAYCIVETEAPAGYVTPQGDDAVTQFTLHHLENRTEGDAQNPTIVRNVTVENIKQTTPNLPNTGGIGVGILAAIGAAIVAAGAWFARRNSNQA